MILYIITFFIISLVGLYISKINNEKETREDKDYKLKFVIYSIISILSIVYIQLLFSDTFINFIKEYTIIGSKMETLKSYFIKQKYYKPTEKTLKMMGGGNLKIRDFINNDMPISDSDMSSIYFQ